MYSFVDRDMMMRYYYGLGVGHTYAHVQTSTSTINDRVAGDLEPIEEQEDEMEGELFQGSNGSLPDAVWHDSDPEGDSDFSILDEGEAVDDSEGASDDEEFYEMETMYNPHY
jgi:hypothetical protein